MQFGSISVEKIIHSAFKIQGKKAVVYMDPWKLPPGSDMADLVLITHDHFDHCSPEDIKKVVRPGTVIVGNSKVKKKLEGIHGIDFRESLPDQNIEIDGLTVRTFPSYNINKFKDGKNLYHPKSEGDLGFILGIDKMSLFYVGDSDNIEEFKLLSVTGINIALLPVSGTYSMTWQEAVEACKVINPDIAIPMHWGEVVGSITDAENFKKNVSCRVEIL